MEKIKEEMLKIYIFVDNYIKAIGNWRKSNNKNPEISDTEIMTMALSKGLLGVDSLLVNNGGIALPNNQNINGNSFNRSSRRNFLALTIVGFLGISWISNPLTLIAQQDKERRLNQNQYHDDIKVLNVLLALEYQLVGVYEQGVQSKLIINHLDLTTKFKAQHEQHRDALIATIKKCGGNFVVAKEKYDIEEIERQLEKTNETLEDNNIILENTQTIEKNENNILNKKETDFLSLLMKLEEQSIKEYSRLIPTISNKDILRAAVLIGMNEAQHKSILSGLLGDDQVPSAFIF